MRPKGWVLAVVDIRRWSFWLWLPFAFCLLLTAGCDIAPTSAPTEALATTAAAPQPVVQTMPSPWDLSWLPGDFQAVATRIDSILDGTGLSGHGATILQYAQEFGVNPAFALAMFKKEAEFAKQGSIAYRQNNPGNIICGGGTTPLYGATGCGGRFGIYDTMADGIKGYYWLLDNEYKPGRKYNCQDIACIITVYCPPSDCDTARYIEQVMQWTTEYQRQLSEASPLAVPPVPRPSGAGRIAFWSSRDGNGEIYIMNADGTGQTNLTNNPAFDILPLVTEQNWSPDGTRIAFQSDRDAELGDEVLDIYVMNADGTGVTRLTNDPESDGEPSWSPDGTRIAFESGRNGPQEIYVVNADGTGETNLTQHPWNDLYPSWSPDGTRIAFESDRDDDNGIHGDIYVMNADGTGQTNLTNNPAYDGHPSWSPDGTRIVFQSQLLGGNSQIYVMNADGTGVTRLTNTSDGAGDYDPFWSPR